MFVVCKALKKVLCFNIKILNEAAEFLKDPA